MTDIGNTCPYCGESESARGAAGSSDPTKAKCGACGNFFSISSKPLSNKDPEPAKNEKTADELLDEGEKLVREGRYEKAVTKLRAAADKSPGRTDILMALGSACISTSMIYDALLAYRRALEIDSGNEDALFKCGMLLIQQKRYSQGIELLDNLISINPDADQARLLKKIAKARQEELAQDSITEIRKEKVLNQERSKRLIELYSHILKTDRKTRAFISLWLVLPVVFGFAYVLMGAAHGRIDILLMAILLYSVFFGVVSHELGHGAAAFMLGDDTAKRAGRLSLNPISHISIIGTLLVPVTAYMVTGVTFGWAKPVPFNPMKLGRQPRDQAVVAAAGPFVSFAMSYLMFTLYLCLAAVHNNFHPDTSVYFTIDLLSPIEVGEGVFEPMWFVALEILGIGSVVNLVLGVFNLIPFPPLDGSWLLKAVAPPSLAISLDRAKWAGLAVIIASVYFGWIVYLFFPAYIILAGYHFLAGAVL